MRQRWVQFDWSIAIILSVLLHGGLIWWMLQDQIRALSHLLAQGIAKSAWLQPREQEPEDQLGDISGQGTSIANSGGERPAAGMEADLDQPFLSRDPMGMGHVGDAPSQYTGPTGSGALSRAMQESAQASVAPPPMRPPASLEPAGELKRVEPTPLAAKPPQAPEVAMATPPAPEVAPTPPAPPSDAKAAPASASPAEQARKPGLPMASADPAPASDSEIDPFSQVGSAEIRAGKMVVRSGRKAKLTRPKIPLAGFWDGVAMGHAQVTMRLTTDSTGQVIRAEVIKSSGSNQIDNPICLEAYNWWFDPRKNAAGDLAPTSFPFTVVVFR